MDSFPQAPRGPSGDAHTVQVFFRRTNIILAALVLAGILAIFSLVYLPLNRALKASLMDNFSQISLVRHQAVQNSIQHGLEGARSLSSRSMIKDAMANFQSGAMSLDQLKAYTQPKYEDGARALDRLILAERYAGTLLIARYTASGAQDAALCADHPAAGSAESLSELCLQGDRIYFVVRSPVAAESRVLGYDRLIFDLTSQLRLLDTGATETTLLPDIPFQVLIADAQQIGESGGARIFYKAGAFYHTLDMQGGTHFVSKQSEQVLFAPVDRLSTQILAAGVGMLLCFAVATYVYIVRFARRELVSLESSHITLEKAVSEAHIDPLTGVGGRRSATEALTRAFEEFLLKGLSPAVILFDIDRLKCVNDAHGHPAGDYMIREIAAAVQKNIRGGDPLFRWGGDEFVVIFHGLKEERAIAVAHKLLEAVSALKLEAGGQVIRPTISMGLSYFKADDPGFTGAFDRADQALYRSKSDGRNRVYVL